MRHWFDVTVRILLGAIFLISGISKLLNLTAFASALRDFELLPESTITFSAIFIPSLESSVGSLLILGYFVKMASTITIILLIVFIAALIPQLAINNEIDCGCFGPLMHETVGTELLIRDLLMLGLSVLCLIQSDPTFRLKYKTRR